MTLEYYTNASIYIQEPVNDKPRCTGMEKQSEQSRTRSKSEKQHAGSKVSKVRSNMRSKVRSKVRGKVSKVRSKVESIVRSKEAMISKRREAK